MIWTPYDWLHKFYNFHVTAVVIYTIHDVRIDAHHRNQPNNIKLVWPVHTWFNNITFLPFHVTIITNVQTATTLKVFFGK